MAGCIRRELLLILLRWKERYPARLSTEHICLLFGYQKQRLKYDVEKASTPTELNTRRRAMQ